MCIICQFNVLHNPSLSCNSDADSYEIGALPATCIERGQPHHGRNPQSTVPPYRIHVDKLEINPGDAVKGELKYEPEHTKIHYIVICFALFQLVNN